MDKIKEVIAKKLEVEFLEDGNFRLSYIEAEVSNNFDDIFVYIDFENFIKNGKKIMAHRPQSDREENFKKLLKEAIEAKIGNFYCTKIDPSIGRDGKIFFERGKWPAVGKSFDWWEKAAKNFLPERGSHLGTKLQYVAFLGVLMQKLVEEKGISVKDAWNAVCKNSKELGHYSDSKDTKHRFEVTGSREVCGFCDLANTEKLLAFEDKAKCFWKASGYYGSSGWFSSLSVLDGFPDLSRYRECDTENAVGWIVLSV